MPTPKQWFRDALADFRRDRSGAERANIREDVAALVTAGQDWLARTDAQESGARSAFALDRPAQYKTFVESLPPVDPAP